MTKTDLLPLSRRLTAAEWWPHDDPGPPNEGVYRSTVTGLLYRWTPDGWALDLEDDGNGGVLLGMLPGRYAVTRASSGMVSVRTMQGSTGPHPTLAAAAALALLEVRGG